MPFPLRALLSLCLLLSLPAAADTTVYQTGPKTTGSQAPREIWSAPVISVDPKTGRTRVFITPDGSFSNNLASHGAPVYHARTLHEPTPAGIQTGVGRLHQQMADTCPQGWIKLQEWARLTTDTPELHYQFQCLGTH